MTDDGKRIYWHRELPPLADRAEGTHEVAMKSPPIPYRPGERDALWERSHGPLMEEAARRIEQEIERLGGDCAHVVDEHIEEKIDNAKGTYHLEGLFKFVLLLPPGP